MSQIVYEIVTEKIINKLEQGVIPWRQPWSSIGTAISWKTQKPYRGINAFLLEPGKYITFKQAQEAGGRIKKGSKSQMVVFWKLLEKENLETGEIEQIPLLRYYKVFNVKTQCEGVENKQKDSEEFNHDPIESAEQILRQYKDAPKIKEAPGRAFYRPSSDMVSVPSISDYKVPEEYYSTLFHELIHSTGHKKRLNRPSFARVQKFGSEDYSKEELVAEFGAAMLCGIARIDNSTLPNSVAYIQSWLRKLKNDNKLVVQAAAQAQKAADYIQGGLTDY
ncbi:ArdC family protein [Desulfoscipio gibsoniae]